MHRAVIHVVAIGAVLLTLGGVKVSAGWIEGETAGRDKGWAAYKRGDYTKALHEWRPRAEEGEGSAQYNLGVMYGKGMPSIVCPLFVEDNVVLGQLATPESYFSTRQKRLFMPGEWIKCPLLARLGSRGVPDRCPLFPQ